MKKSSDANTSSKESNVGSSKSQASTVHTSKPLMSIPNHGVDDESKKLSDDSKVTDALSVANEDESKKLSDNSKMLDALSVANEDEFNKLPDKYKILDNFFNRLDTLVSLHGLKRWTPTFTSISSGMESLTNMRFTHTHLAQLKYILPDGIVLEKHIGLDKRTSTTKPDILISLDRDAVEADSLDPDPVDVDPLDPDEVEEAKSLERRRRLRKVFRARLIDFCKSHPKGDDIPEGTLPEPFNCPKKHMLETHMLETDLPTFPRRMRYTVNNAGSKFAELGESVELPIEDVAAPGKFSHRMRYIVKNAESESANLGESVELPIEDLAAPPSDTPSLRADDVELPIEDLAAPSTF